MSAPSIISHKPRKPASVRRRDREFYIKLTVFILSFGVGVATTLALIFDSRWSI